MDFVECPGCRARVWEDLHALENGIATRFRCVRCGFIMTPGSCSRCRKKGWIRLSDIVEKEGKKPVVRFQCSSCSRIIGIILD